MDEATPERLSISDIRGKDGEPARFWVPLPGDCPDELGARTVAYPLSSAGSYGSPQSDAIDAAPEIS